jgi:hypothetical protein
MKRARNVSIKLTAVFTTGVLQLLIGSSAANAAEPFFMGLGDLPGGGLYSGPTPSRPTVPLSSE